MAGAARERRLVVAGVESPRGNRAACRHRHTLRPRGSRAPASAREVRVDERAEIFVAAGPVRARARAEQWKTWPGILIAPQIQEERGSAASPGSQALGPHSSVTTASKNCGRATGKSRNERTSIGQTARIRFPDTRSYPAGRSEPFRLAGRKERREKCVAEPRRIRLHDVGDFRGADIRPP